MTPTGFATRRTAIYSRVSTGAQEEDGTSLPTQEAARCQYAAEHGYEEDEGHVYREVYSGAALREAARQVGSRSRAPTAPRSST